MIYRTSNMPGFSEYIRRYAKYRLAETDGIDCLPVPFLLEKNPFDPVELAEIINGIVICDMVGGEMIANQEKTQEARELLAKRAPRIMKSGEGGDLHQKLGLEPPLIYAQLPDEQPLQLLSPLYKYDYVATLDAALLYVSGVAGISKSMARSAIRKELIQFTQGGKPLLGRRIIKLFLLEELNALADKLR